MHCIQLGSALIIGYSPRCSTTRGLLGIGARVRGWSFGKPSCLLGGRTQEAVPDQFSVLGGFSDFSFPCPRWRRSTAFLCNALLEKSCSLCSSRFPQPCRWTVFVFNFFGFCSFPYWGFQNNTRPGVHVHSTRTDEPVSNPCMVSEPACRSHPSSPNSWLLTLRVQTLSADGVWPASEVDLTAGCDARRANWPAQQHWSRIRK